MSKTSFQAITLSGVIQSNSQFLYSGGTQAEPVSRVGLGLGEWEARYGAKGMRSTLLVKSSLSLDTWDSGNELVLKLGKRIVKLTGWAGWMNSENRNEVL